jgi:hypothetical protein
VTRRQRNKFVADFDETQYCWIRTRQACPPEYGRRDSWGTESWGSSTRCRPEHALHTFEHRSTCTPTTRCTFQHYGHMWLPFVSHDNPTVKAVYDMRDLIRSGTEHPNILKKLCKSSMLLSLHSCVTGRLACHQKYRLTLISQICILRHRFCYSSELP